MKPFLLQGHNLRVAVVLLVFLSILMGLYEFNIFDLTSFPTKTSPNYTKAPPHLESHFVPPDAQRKDYHEWNAQTLRDLHACMATHSCGPNQRKVAILAAHWFQEAVVTGWRGGEGVWYVFRKMASPA
jgi:hypothetical protein